MRTKMTDAERAEKLAKLYDGQPMVVHLKVWMGKRFEMREFTIDNLQDVRQKLQDVELLDMRYLKPNPAQESESYAIKQVGTTKVSASIPKLLFGLPAGTRKAVGASQRDLRKSSYLVK